MFHGRVTLHNFSSSPIGWGGGRAAFNVFFNDNNTESNSLSLDHFGYMFYNYEMNNADFNNSKEMNNDFNLQRCDQIVCLASLSAT